MKLPSKTSIKLLAGSAASIAVMSVAAVMANQPAVQATEEPPIVTQVNDHENRITKLESDDTATQAQVTQNTSDISSLQSRTATDTSSAATTQTSSSTTTSTQGETTPPPTPQPQPEPTPDPRTIIAVSESTQGDIRTCNYTLYSESETNHLGAIMQPVDRPCYQVGDVLPRDL